MKEYVYTGVGQGFADVLIYIPHINYPFFVQHGCINYMCYRTIASDRRVILDDALEGC
jgi:hypothetical protein